MPHKLITLPENVRMIVLGIVVILLIVRASQYFLFHAKASSNLAMGAPRDYGLGGGAICPKCHRPFRISLFGLKVGLGTKLVRCEFCGKWSLVRRAGIDELRAAEAAELADAQAAQAIPEKSEAQKLNDLVDESRYTDKL